MGASLKMDALNVVVKVELPGLEKFDNVCLDIVEGGGGAGRYVWRVCELPAVHRVAKWGEGGGGRRQCESKV